jgi:hypothetical protein
MRVNLTFVKKINPESNVRSNIIVIIIIIIIYLFIYSSFAPHGA